MYNNLLAFRIKCSARQPYPVQLCVFSSIQPNPSGTNKKTHTHIRTIYTNNSSAMPITFVALQNRPLCVWGSSKWKCAQRNCSHCCLFVLGISTPHPLPRISEKQPYLFIACNKIKVLFVRDKYRQRARFYCNRCHRLTSLAITALRSHLNARKHMQRIDEWMIFCVNRYS